ncbi:MAG: molybdopterin converting factor subunit 1 [Burkholderiaceae bacterium]|jgi:molybdopterin synthase sulfur carrier subunit|nr:MAG: molybdopterin converting factor subunit 1 [Burkholderiaceae bacterium]
MSEPAGVQVTVRYFASLREALGTGGEQVRTSAATLGALRAELAARGGAYAEALAPQKAVRAALNQVMADDARALVAGAEVAFFPPVTGG